jgi:ABC-type transporter Mla subunit MlaD
VRFLDVLDEHPLLPTGARRSLLPALPSIFLAFGLLGTFVGLGLALSGDAFGTTDGSVSLDVGLLTAQVGLSLRAALWGIGLSIIAGVSGRLIDGAFEGTAARLDRSVQRCFPLVSSSELTSFGQRAQHESLVALGSELTRFTTDLTERLDRGLQRIERSTANAASLVSEEQRSAVQSVIRDLALQVRQGVDDHLSALQGALDRATEHQDTVTGGIAAAFNQMADQSEAHARVTQSLDEAATTVEAASGSFRQTVVDFQPVLTHLRDAGASLEATSERIDATHGVVAKAAEDVRMSLQHAASAVGEQRDFVEVSLGEIRATLDALSTGLGENLNKSLRAVDDALGQTVGRLRETIVESNDTIERMSHPMRSAEGTARELHSALERARSEITGLGEWLAQAMKPVRSSLTQLDERTTDVARALANFGDHAMGMDKTMDALRGDLREEGRKFRASTADLSRKLNSTADALAHLEQAGTALDPRISRGSTSWPGSAVGAAPPIETTTHATKAPTASAAPIEAASSARVEVRPRAAATQAPDDSSAPQISREALRHSGAALSPSQAASSEAGTLDDPEPEANADDAIAQAPATSLPPFKLGRAPGPGDSRPDETGSATSWARASGFDSRRATTDRGSRPFGEDTSFAGRRLGPDPYSRPEHLRTNGADSSNSKGGSGASDDRPLAADLAPDATLEEKADELSLSGLLGGRPGGENALPRPIERGSDDSTAQRAEDESER